MMFAPELFAGDMGSVDWCRVVLDLAVGFRAAGVGDGGACSSGADTRYYDAGEPGTIMWAIRGTLP